MHNMQSSIWTHSRDSLVESIKSSAIYTRRKIVLYVYPRSFRSVELMPARAGLDLLQDWTTRVDERELLSILTFFIFLSNSHDPRKSSHVSRFSELVTVSGNRKILIIASDALENGGKFFHHTLPKKKLDKKSRSSFYHLVTFHLDLVTFAYSSLLQNSSVVIANWNINDNEQSIATFQWTDLWRS